MKVSNFYLVILFLPVIESSSSGGYGDKVAPASVLPLREVLMEVRNRLDPLVKIGEIELLVGRM
jgi:hypothetical protein